MVTAVERGWPMPPFTVKAGTLARVVCSGDLPMYVRPEVKPLFDELVVRIEAVTHPGFMTSSGGYNFRAKRTMERAWELSVERGHPNLELLSNHAFGMAGDFRAGTNPGYTSRACDFPPETRQIAADVGLSWGGTWTNPYDPMHFEFIGTVRGAQLQVTKLQVLRTLKGVDMTDDQFKELSGKLDSILYQLGYDGSKPAGQQWGIFPTLDGTNRKLTMLDMLRETHRELNMRLSRQTATDTLYGHVLNIARSLKL